jgi:hypothetical protein
MRVSLKDKVTDLNKDALWLIGQVMNKHTSAILEEMIDQLKIKDARIAELESKLMQQDR